MRAGLAVLALVALVGCEKRSRSTDTASTSLPTAAARVEFLCSYLLCPDKPADAAFHVVVHDNSGGLLPGPSDWFISAVIKVAPDQTERWATGCTAHPSDARPDWAKPLLAEHPEWQPKGLPDGYSCPGGQIRLIYVKDGLVFLHVETS